MKPDIAPQPAPGGADREQLLALVNSMTDGVLALDPKFKVTLSNGAALSLLDSNSILGSGIDDVLKLSNKQGAPVALTQQIFAEPNGFTRRDWRLLYDDGTSISLFLSLSPVMFSFGGAGPGGYVLLLRDITREKSLEEERDEFISVAAHELRTPVAVAEGNISNGLLQAQREHASDEIIHALSAAHQQITFLADMLNDLSTLSRAEQGKLAMRIEEFDVGELVSSLVHDYRPAAQQKNLELVYSGDAEVGKLASSRLYVREILQNFITNAIKYTEKGSITITTERQGDGVEFTVADTGIGVGKNERQKLFNKFFRSDDWRVKKINGTGLGLYVTAKLIKLISGRLSFESELNRGSTFRVHVPHLGSPSRPHQPEPFKTVAKG